MAWTKSATTKHTCGGPAFGRLTAGCPRCDELAAGAAPVKWATSARRDDDRMRSAAIHEHFARFHRGGTCYRDGRPNRNCTFGDW